MKDQLVQLSAYNSWANQKLLDAVLLLPPEKFIQEMPSSFSSLQKTILHMWDAESIWWQRLRLQEQVIAPSKDFSGTAKELANGLSNQNKLWHEWILGASDASINHVFQYYNSKKEHFKSPAYQVIIHVFNHGTYHRGQIVNMLRQLGVEKIPQTDFIVWARKK